MIIQAMRLAYYEYVSKAPRKKQSNSRFQLRVDCLAYNSGAVSADYLCR